MNTPKIFDLNREKLTEIKREWEATGSLSPGDTCFLIRHAENFLSPQHQQIDRTIIFLNELLALDRHAVQELLAQRVPCNEALADHPTVQVSAGGATGTTFVPPNGYRVGLLGVLNGLLGVDNAGWGWITAVYDTAGVLKRFVRTTGPAGEAP